VQSWPKKKKIKYYRMIQTPTIYKPHWEPFNIRQQIEKKNVKLSLQWLLNIFHRNTLHIAFSCSTVMLGSLSGPYVPTCFLKFISPYLSRHPLSWL
jgi:hypothetical protein